MKVPKTPFLVGRLLREAGAVRHWLTVERTLLPMQKLAASVYLVLCLKKQKQKLLSSYYNQSPREKDIL